MSCEFKHFYYNFQLSTNLSRYEATFMSYEKEKQRKRLEKLNVPQKTLKHRTKSIVQQ